LTVTPTKTASNLSQAMAAEAGAGLVKVTRCGTPVNNAAVGVTVIPSAAPSDAYNVPAKFTGSGQYSYSIPTQPGAGQKVENLCTGLAEGVGKVCDGLSFFPQGVEFVIAETLRAALVLVGLGAGAVAAVVGAFMVAFEAAKLYCDTLGAGPAPGAPSIAEKLCGNISEVVDRFTNGEVRLIPLVFIPGRGLVDGLNGMTALATGPFPTFDINAGGKAEIVSFTTTPADPAPGQNYIAEALIQCAPPGTQVTLSIAGTDGYSNSKTATIPGDANVTLTVPGAEAGVRDVVTVTVSNGPTKQIALIF
jgi:hypothetical protein